MHTWKAFFAGDFFADAPRTDSFMDAELESFVRAHDIRGCNFEGTLDAPGAQPIAKVGPHMRQTEQAPRWLREAGFNIVCLANNHVCDLGTPGLRQTLRSLDGIATVGAGETAAEAYRLQILIVHGLRVGFLAFGEAQFGVLSGSNTAGYAWINHPGVNQCIMDARRQVDVLIVQSHAGIERINLPLPEWRARYRDLIESGADIVIGHHPHVAQGWEYYHDRLIVYSCGNFYFPSDTGGTGYGVSLDFDGPRLHQARMLPLSLTGGRVGLDRDSAAHRHLENLCLSLAEPAYSRQMENVAAHLWNERYEPTFRRASGGIRWRSLARDLARAALKPRRQRDLLLLDMIQNESHRWAVQRALAARQPSRS